MRRRMREERGAITVEACLALSLFIVGFMTILSFSVYTRVEALTQYAINETAKEISRYLYILERAGLQTGLKQDENVEKVDEAVENLIGLTGAIGDGYSNASSVVSSGIDFSSIDNIDGIIQTAGNDFKSIQGSAQAVANSMGALMENPAAVLKSMLSLAGDTAARRVGSRILAPPICRTLCQKYMGENSHEKLMGLGVVGGIEGLDFSMSSILYDGRTVTVSVVYRVEGVLPSLLDQPHVIRQTASTAAWVNGVAIKDIPVSNWGADPLQRGSDFVEERKKEDPLYAVKGGSGVDLYYPDGKQGEPYNYPHNTYVYIHSMNVFSPSYSDYQPGFITNEENASCYTLKESQIKSAIKQNVIKAQETTNKIGDTLTMEDGTIMQTAPDLNPPRVTVVQYVVPNEALYHSDTLNKIASEIEAELANRYPGQQIRIDFTYRDYALGEIQTGG